MSYSVLLLTATCLASGPVDDRITPTPAQVSQAAAVAGLGELRAEQSTSAGNHGRPHASAEVSSDCCKNSCDDCCSHKPGFFARLFCRLGMLFHRSSCCDVCGKSCSTCDCHASPSLFCRLRSLFRHHCAEDACCGKDAAVIVSAPAALPMPVVKTVEARPASSPMEIKKEYLDRVSNATDYSWVTGQLFYIHADKGLWVVRYAPVDREDRYGGSVVLAAAANMSGFQEGDLVTVHGEILDSRRASKYLGGPLYRALTVTLNDRGEQP